MTRLIDELKKLLRSKRLDLLFFMIEKNKYMASNEIRSQFDKRNPNQVKEDLEVMYSSGLLSKRLRNSKVGKARANIKFEKYKINLENSIIKLLINEVKCLQE